MFRLRLVTATAAFVLGAGVVGAQTNEMPPERAPAAQQFAPPAKIAPPINAGERKPDVKPETTGQAPKPGPAASDSPTTQSSPGKDPATDTHGNETRPSVK